MTMIIDHATSNPTTGPWAFANAVVKAVGTYSNRKRTARRIRREHEMLMAMSSHDLHDIGMVRGDVAFGVSSGRGVFREADRPAA